MKKSIISIIILIGCLFCMQVSAQTFSVGRSNNAAKENTNMLKPATKAVNLSGKKTTPTIAKNTAEKKTPSEATENKGDDVPQLTKSVRNIDNEEITYGDKKYDNTYGSVVTFRMKDGKLEIDDNTERKILVWYEDYKLIKGMDGIVRCSIRVYVFNDMVKRISNLGFKIIWPDIRAGINMTKVNPGVRTYIDTMLLGEGCFKMDTTPVIEVNRCRVRGMSEEKCADAVHWFHAH